MKTDALYQKLICGKLDHLTLGDKQQIEPVLRKYTHVFHDEDMNDFKGTNVIEHQIPIGDAQHIRHPSTEPQHLKARDAKTSPGHARQRHYSGKPVSLVGPSDSSSK